MVWVMPQIRIPRLCRIETDREALGDQAEISKGLWQETTRDYYLCGLRVGARGLEPPQGASRKMGPLVYIVDDLQVIDDLKVRFEGNSAQVVVTGLTLSR